MLRKKLAEIIEKYVEPEYDETLFAIRADLLRRSGQFEKVIDDYSNIIVEDGLISQILKFQIKMAKEQNDRQYTVEDVTNPDNKFPKAHDDGKNYEPEVFDACVGRIDCNGRIYDSSWLGENRVEK